MFNNWLRVGKPWHATPDSFWGVNIPRITHFEQPIWYYWNQSWGEMLATGSHPVGTGASTPLEAGCCCCQVTSVMSDSVWPHRRQPTRLPRPWDSPGKNTGVGCHFLLQCTKVKRESEVAQSYLTLSDPWTAAYKAPPSMVFSRQEYWSGVPSPSPRSWVNTPK